MVQSVNVGVCALAALATLATIAYAESVGCRNTLAKTPPMGWMSWEIFRCTTDCDKYPSACINEDLYKTTGDAMKQYGFLDAGYDTVHIDDCWMNKGRNATTGQLYADTSRFPSGMKGLADYLHGLGLKLGLYTAESPTTCAGYTASYQNEIIDAQTFADWGVDYMKVDGCGGKDYYPTGYTAMGTALQITGRDIVYSCSWPAYIGSDPTVKPFNTMISIGCNLWRNWDDIQCSWKSLSSIIDYWGQHAEYMAQFAGPGHWHDPDMLLIGNPCITDDEARTQMAIWSIVAAPLIMGNDARNMTQSTRAILLNRHAIAINQDPAGLMGHRVTPDGPTQVWARNLSDGSVAVALYNKGSSNGGSAAAAVINAASRTRARNHPENAHPLTAEAQLVVRKLNSANTGLASSSFGANTTAITVSFSQIGLSSTTTADVFDVWAQASKGVVKGSYTASVPLHGTAFLRISPTN